MVGNAGLLRIKSIRTIREPMCFPDKTLPFNLILTELRVFFI